MFWPNKDLYSWAQNLANGGVGIAPAEGVYGYVADPFNEQSLQALTDIKKRSGAKGFIVLCADKSDLKRLCPPLSTEEKKAIKENWWGAIQPTTLILPAKENLPDLLTGGRETIAVRQPFVPYMQTYLHAWKSVSGHGILVSTSCNITGQMPATSKDALPDHPEAHTLALGQPLSGTPSRIYDTLTQKYTR